MGVKKGELVEKSIRSRAITAGLVRGQRQRLSNRNRKAYAIKTFFGFLEQAGFIRTNPASALIPPTIPQKERRFLREEEYQSLLAQAHTSRDRAILEVFLQTGLRLSGLTHLMVNDVELPRRITKDPETRKRRVSQSPAQERQGGASAAELEGRRSAVSVAGRAAAVDRARVDGAGSVCMQIPEGDYIEGYSISGGEVPG